MPHAYSVKQSEEICRTLNALRLGNSLSDIYLEHVKTMTHSVFFMLGCKGKVVNAGFFSAKHRTTVAHFLNNGKWDSPNFEKALKRQVIDRIYPLSVLYLFPDVPAHSMKGTIISGIVFYKRFLLKMLSQCK